MSPARGRILRRAVAASFSLHMAATCAASLAWIVAVERVPAPPVIIRFVPTLSPVPHTSHQPLEAETRSPEEQVTPAPPPPVARPTPPPPTPPPPRPAVAENAVTEHAPEIPKTSEVQVEAIPKDTFEPPAPLTATGRGGGPGVALIPGYVDTFAPAGGVRAGGVPDLDPPVPGTARAGAGGLPAGTPAGSPALPADSVRPEGTSTVGRPRGGRTGAGTSSDGPESGPGDGGEETAVLLGRRYNIDLIDASRLGRSTHDGWRYNLLVPMLSELYHRVEEAGRPAKPGDAAGDDVLSVRVDPDAVIIAYSDGTKHVIAPTKDGLVALYVTRGAVGHGKVDEAQRALGALRRLTHDGVRS